MNKWLLWSAGAVAAGGLVFVGVQAAATVPQSAHERAAAPEGAAIPIAEARRGAAVTLAGVVDRILDEDEFRLKDASGDIEVYLGPNWVRLAPGETVTVSGWIDDDIPRELYARKIVRADGSVLTFDHRYD